MHNLLHNLQQYLNGIHFFASIGDTKTVHIILRHNPILIDLRSKEHRTPFLTAAFYSQPLVASLLLKHDQSIIHQVDQYGSTALHYAVKNNDISTTQILLGNGADIHKTDRFGNNSIDIAIKNKNTDALSHLLRET